MYSPKTKPNRRKRIIATILDYAVIWSFCIIYILYFGEPNEEGGYSVHGIKTLPMVAFWFSYLLLTSPLPLNAGLPTFLISI